MRNSLRLIFSLILLVVLVFVFMLMGYSNSIHVLILFLLATGLFLSVQWFVPIHSFIHCVLTIKCFERFFFRVILQLPKDVSLNSTKETSTQTPKSNKKEE
jgi:cytochrome bd-type quinol oxidase subunit 1